jgi:tartrate-resistant acid phosphatase type 5
MTVSLFKQLTITSALCLFFIVTGCDLIKPPPSELGPSPKVEFIAFGDSGYLPQKSNSKKKKKTDHLSGLIPASQALKNYCQQENCEFSVMLGDNIYPAGATLDPTEPWSDKQKFQDVFSTPFGDLGKNKDNYSIYVTLGNHDWGTSREGAMLELDFMESTPPFYMNGLFYSVKPPAGKGEVELFIIDTTMLLASTDVYSVRLDKLKRELPPTKMEKPKPYSKPQTLGEKNMVQWLDLALKNSSAKWKLVVGHHPIWSGVGGKSQQGKSLRRLILPTLCRYADAYFSGHEHTLELHEDSCETVLNKPTDVPLPQILSGAMAKQRTVSRQFIENQSKLYPQVNTLWTLGDTWGFSHITIEDNQMVVKMISTPSSRTGEPVLEHTHTFKHRSKH